MRVMARWGLAGVASEVVMAARTGDCWCTGELDSSLSLVSGEENQTELCISRV